MKKIKLLFVTVMVFVAAGLASAQNIRVSGVVTDENGPVPGATVMVQGDQRNGTATDGNGAYSLTVPSDATLVVTCIGYNDEVVKVDGRTTVNIRISEDNETLEATVVVGYGSAKKVGNLTGSITTVSSEKIKNAPAASALDKLQGQVAGLQVLTTGGVAGDNNVSMTLHGIGSLTAGTAPLYIIDGIPASSRTVMSINPNDILSISVLKDASATSIYGARAANGVIVVTTRSGSFDSRASVTIRSQYGLSTLADRTLYENMMNAAELKDFWVKAGIHTPQNIYETYTQYGFDADEQWWKHSQRLTTPQYQNDVIVEGGSSKVAYMVGASQFHQTGTTVGNFYDRYTVRSNVQGVPKNWLRVGVNMNLSYEKTRSNANWGSSSSNANYSYGGLSYLQLPFYPFIDPITGKEYELEYPSGMPQYKYYSDMIVSISSYYNLLGSAYVQIEPVRNLKIRSQVGTDATFLFWDNHRDARYYTQVGNGTRGKEQYLSYTNTISNTVEYAFDFGDDHKITLLAGQEGTAYEYDMTYAWGSNLPDYRIQVLDNVLQTTKRTEESYSAYKFLSFFGHADYTYRDKYIFDATIRDDASSRFGADNRHGIFWSAAALWKMKKEAALRNVSWLNSLNMKVSYGTQGNAGIGNYSSLGLVGSSSSYQEVNGQTLSQPANPELAWEKQDLLTVGLDGRVFDWLDFNFEFYNRVTSHMLMSVPQPYTTGFSSLTQNIGGMYNRGLDITLGADILRGKDYYLRASTTFNYNKEKITKLFQGQNHYEIANTYVAYTVGHPVAYYSAIFAGINPDNGLQQWYLPKGVTEIFDADGNGSLVFDDDWDETWADETVKDPSRVTSNWYEEGLTQNTGKKRNAPVYGGFSLSGGWKGLSVQADFSYVLGKYLINNDMYFYANPNQFSDDNQHKMVQDYWTPSNRDAKFPDWSSGQTMKFDSHLIEDADFLRLKSLQVGYNLPKKVINLTKGAISDVRFTFTGRNLFILTNYTGIDPEVNSNLTTGKPGNSKQYLFGVEVTF